MKIPYLGLPYTADSAISTQRLAYFFVLYVTSRSLSLILLVKMLLLNISCQSLRTKFNHFFDSWWFSRPGITNSLIYMPTPVYEELLPGALRKTRRRVRASHREHRLCRGQRMSIGSTNTCWVCDSQQNTFSHRMKMSS